MIEQPAHYFDREYFELHPGKLRYLRWVRRLLSTHGVDSGHLLDYGCGFGFLLAEFASAGFDVQGIDVSSPAVAESERRVAGRARVVEPGSPLPFSDRSFAAITMLDVIEHIEDVPAALAQCHRCLEPGGHFAVITLNRESLAYRLMGRRWSWFQDPTHVHLFSPAMLRAALESAGFEIIRWSTIWNFCVVGETTRALRPLRRLGRVVEWPRFGDSLLAVARRPQGTS